MREEPHSERAGSKGTRPTQPCPKDKDTQEENLNGPMEEADNNEPIEHGASEGNDTASGLWRACLDLDSQRKKNKDTDEVAEIQSQVNALVQERRHVTCGKYEKLNEDEQAAVQKDVAATFISSVLGISKEQFQKARASTDAATSSGQAPVDDITL